MSKRDIGLTFDSIFLAKHRRIFLFFCVHLPRQKAPSKVPLILTLSGFDLMLVKGLKIANRTTTP